MSQTTQSGSALLSQDFIALNDSGINCKSTIENIVNSTGSSPASATSQSKSLPKTATKSSKADYPVATSNQSESSLGNPNEAMNYFDDVERNKQQHSARQHTPRAQSRPYDNRQHRGTGNHHPRPSFSTGYGMQHRNVHHNGTSSAPFSFAGSQHLNFGRLGKNLALSTPRLNRPSLPQSVTNTQQLPSLMSISNPFFKPIIKMETNKTLSKTTASNTKLSSTSTCKATVANTMVPKATVSNTMVTETNVSKVTASNTMLPIATVSNTMVSKAKAAVLKSTASKGAESDTIVPKVTVSNTMVSHTITSEALSKATIVNTMVPNAALSNRVVSKATVSMTMVFKATASDTMASKTTISKANVFDTIVPKTTVSDTMISKATVSETMVSKTIQSNTMVTKATVSSVTVSKTTALNAIVSNAMVSNTIASSALVSNTFVSCSITSTADVSTTIASNTRMSTGSVADTVMKSSPVKTTSTTQSSLNAPISNASVTTNSTAKPKLQLQLNSKQRKRKDQIASQLCAMYRHEKQIRVLAARKCDPTAAEEASSIVKSVAIGIANCPDASKLTNKQVNNIQYKELTRLQAAIYQLRIKRALLSSKADKEGARSINKIEKPSAVQKTSALSCNPSTATVSQQSTTPILLTSNDSTGIVKPPSTPICLASPTAALPLTAKPSANVCRNFNTVTPLTPKHLPVPSQQLRTVNSLESKPTARVIQNQNTAIPNTIIPSTVHEPSISSIQQPSIDIPWVYELNAQPRQLASSTHDELLAENVEYYQLKRIHELSNKISMLRGSNPQRAFRKVPPTIILPEKEILDCEPYKLTNKQLNRFREITRLKSNLKRLKYDRYHNKHFGGKDGKILSSAEKKNKSKSFEDYHRDYTVENSSTLSNAMDNNPILSPNQVLDSRYGYCGNRSRKSFEMEVEPTQSSAAGTSNYPDNTEMLQGIFTSDDDLSSLSSTYNYKRSDSCARRERYRTRQYESTSPFSSSKTREEYSRRSRSNSPRRRGHFSRSHRRHAYSRSPTQSCLLLPHRKEFRSRSRSNHSCSPTRLSRSPERLLRSMRRHSRSRSPISEKGFQSRQRFTRSDSQERRSCSPKYHARSRSPRKGRRSPTEKLLLPHLRRKPPHLRSQEKPSHASTPLHLNDMTNNTDESHTLLPQHKSGSLLEDTGNSNYETYRYHSDPEIPQELKSGHAPLSESIYMDEYQSRFSRIVNGSEKRPRLKSRSSRDRSPQRKVVINASDLHPEVTGVHNFTSDRQSYPTQMEYSPRPQFDEYSSASLPTQPPQSTPWNIYGIKSIDLSSTNIAAYVTFNSCESALWFKRYFDRSSL